MSIPDPLPSQGIYRILVCRPNHRLGNTLLITPLIAELEKHYKGAEIDIVSEGDIAREVFAGYFSVRRIFCLPKRGFKHPIAFLRTLFQIRGTQYDLIVDPSVRSGYGRTLTRVLRARFKLGFSDKPTRALTHAAPRALAGRHMAQRPVNLVRWATQAPATVPEGYPPLSVRLGGIERSEGVEVVAALAARQGGHKPGPVVGIFGNATGSKRYSRAWWADFLATFQATFPNASILEIIPAHGHSMLGDGWPGYFSSDIRHMAAVLAALDLFITADCGVMHLAASASVPTIGLFKATVLDIYAPYGGYNAGMDTGDASGSDIARRVIAQLAASQGSPLAPARRPDPAASVTGPMRLHSMQAGGVCHDA